MSQGDLGATPGRDSVGRDGQNVAFVHDFLRSEILVGAIRPGATMTQSGLAQALGVSRTPLREALRLLQQEGLVFSEPNRRIRIAGLSAADAEELYAVRITVEATALQASLPRLRSEDFAELEGLLAQMDHYVSVGDIDRIGIPHREFHLRFLRPSGTRFTEVAGLYFDHAERYRRAWGAIREPRAAYRLRSEEHRAILDAAEARDAPRAAEELAIHYARTATVVIASLEPDRDLSLLRSTIGLVAPGALAAVFEPAD